MSILSNWNTEARWLENGGKIDFDENEDYVIGQYKSEDETKVKHMTSSAKVGPAKKIDKVIKMEGASDELSRPGVVLIIQERDNNYPERSPSTVRNILKMIYARGHRGQEEIGHDSTGNDHRFSAIYFNNSLIEPNDNTPNNSLSKTFNEFITGESEVKLSDIIEKAKHVSSSLIGIKENDKSVLYTIADTTCNVYATEDISHSPQPDQSEGDIVKSEKKAKQISKFLLPREYTPHTKVVKPLMASVTPSHGTDFLYVGTEPRLRMRKGDRPSLARITEESESEKSHHTQDKSSEQSREPKSPSSRSIPFVSDIKVNTEKELNRSKTLRSRKAAARKTAKKTKIKYSKHRLGSRISQKMANRFLNEVKQMGGRKGKKRTRRNIRNKNRVRKVSKRR